MLLGLTLNPARFEVQVLGQELIKRVLPAEDSFLVRGPMERMIFKSSVRS